MAERELVSKILKAADAVTTSIQAQVVPPPHPSLALSDSHSPCPTPSLPLLAAQDNNTEAMLDLLQRLLSLKETMRKLKIELRCENSRASMPADKIGAIHVLSMEMANVQHVSGKLLRPSNGMLWDLKHARSDNKRKEELKNLKATIATSSLPVLEKSRAQRSRNPDL